MDEIFLARVVDPETIEKIDKDSVKEEVLSEMGFTRFKLPNGEVIFVQSKPNTTMETFRSVIVDGQVTNIRYLYVEREEIGTDYQFRKTVFSVDDFWVPVPGDFAELDSTIGGVFTGFFYAGPSLKLSFTGHEASTGKTLNEFVQMNHLTSHRFKKLDPPKPPANK